MGEIADGLINGDFDSITGEYLGEGYGFPRSIHDDPAHYRNDRARHKAYWNSLSKEQQEVMKTYQSIRGKNNTSSYRMMEISKFISKELKLTKLPKSDEQYKLVYNNIDKFKEFLKTSK
jgi:hypothetical protein